MRKQILRLALVAAFSLAAVGDLISEPRLVTCGIQMRTLSIALDMYETDHGRYPKSLNQLSPIYMKKLPTCPAAKFDSYSKSYRVKKGEYSFCCQGAFHLNAGLAVNQPTLSRSKGLGPSGMNERIARFKTILPTRPLTRCKQNIVKLATALENYAGDHDGKYPSNLRLLAPRYLKGLPTCLGSDSYSATYQVRTHPDNYSFYCKGEHHIFEGGKSNRPLYNGEQGLDD